MIEVSLKEPLRVQVGLHTVFFYNKSPVAYSGPSGSWRMPASAERPEEIFTKLGCKAASIMDTNKFNNFLRKAAFGKVGFEGDNGEQS